MQYQSTSLLNHGKSQEQNDYQSVMKLQAQEQEDRKFAGKLQQEKNDHEFTMKLQKEEYNPRKNTFKEEAKRSEVNRLIN